MVRVMLRSKQFCGAILTPLLLRRCGDAVEARDALAAVVFTTRRPACHVSDAPTFLAAAPSSGGSGDGWRRHAVSLSGRDGRINLRVLLLLLVLVLLCLQHTRRATPSGRRGLRCCAPRRAASPTSCHCQTPLVSSFLCHCGRRCHLLQFGSG